MNKAASSDRKSTPISFPCQTISRTDFGKKKKHERRVLNAYRHMKEELFD